MRLKMNLKKQYILSYAFVVLAVIALSNSFLIMTSVSVLSDTLEHEQMERGQLLTEDMVAQLDGFVQIRNEMKTNYVFQPLYQQKLYTRRLELIDALDHYVNYLLSDAELYLLYRGDDLIFFQDTCADWETLCRLYWKIDAYDPLRRTLFESEETQILRPEALSGDIVVALPFSLGYGASREQVCLFFRVPQRAVEQRLMRVSGLQPEEYSVSFRGALMLGDEHYDWRNIVSENGDFTVGLSGISGEAYERLYGMQTMLLLICGVITALSLGMAISMAVRQYRPIGFIYRRFGGEDVEQNQNELAHIEHVISDTLRENDRVKHDISVQMDSLKAQSKIIEQQAVKLRGRLLLLLLLGVYRDSDDLPDELTELFVHPKFAVLSVWGANETSLREIEALSNDRYRLFAVRLAGQERTAVLANLEENEDMSALANRLGECLGREATLFAGERTDIRGVSASFIHSGSLSAMQEPYAANELLLSPDCQELFRAVRMGNREVAEERARDFSARLLREQLPMLELRRVYLTLLKKLQNLAGELECAVSERNATALLVSLTPEELAQSLEGCVADLCEDDETDEQPSEALELLRYIDEHACERDMSLLLLEDVFDMSRKKITAIVKSLTDMGFREYVVYQRIERAKLLLLNTKLSVSAIAELCGYESASYFIKSFKSMTNQTPGQFQKENL